MNRKLGSVFWTAVATSVFPGNQTKCPYVRMACVTANLICPEDRVVDGVAKLLTNTDLTAICRKSAFASLMAAEVSLQEAWDLMTLGEKNGVIDGVVKTRIFGKLSSRLALFLAKKQKEGLEGHVYKSIQEIVDAYKAELQIDASGMPLPIAAANAPGSPATCEAPVEMSSMSDPIFIAKEKGFKEGKCFTSKDHPDMVFKLESFSEPSVAFKQQRAEGLHGPALLVVNVGFDDLILFQETKRKLQALLPPSDLIQSSVGRHATLLRDQERAAVYSEFGGVGTNACGGGSTSGPMVHISVRTPLLRGHQKGQARPCPGHSPGQDCSDVGHISAHRQRH